MSEGTSGETWPPGEEGASDTPTPTHDQSQLRCLDFSHPASCARCQAAPSLEDEKLYELVSDPGKKNGEKRVRHLITKTPEWSSAAERGRLAVFCDSQPGLESLGQALRDKACSALRKGHMLFLVRTWGYRSDLWASRGARQKKGDRPDAGPSTYLQLALPVPASADGVSSAARWQQPQQSQPAAPPAPAAAPQLSLATAVTGRALELHYAQVIMPLASECTQAVAGYAACTAAYAHGGDHLTEEAAQLVTRKAVAARDLGVSWRGMSDFVRAKLASLDAARMVPENKTMGDEPAYEQCLGKTFPAEKLINALATAVQKSALYNTQLAAVTEAEVAWVTELSVAYKTSLRVMANVLSIIAQAQLGTLRDCLASYLLALDCLVQWSVNLEAGWQQREAWMREFMRKRGPGTAAVCILSDNTGPLYQEIAALKSFQKAGGCGGAATAAGSLETRALTESVECPIMRMLGKA